MANSLEESIQDVEKIIEALETLTRVSRHAGFRFVYFGADNDFRANVRMLIEDRIMNCHFSEYKVTEPVLDDLVDKFIQKTRPQHLSDDVRRMLQEKAPMAWSKIAG